MAIPQFHNEGPDQQGGSASLTVSFAGFTWSANDIIEIIIATDGWVPVLTTANGFALAQDPAGNTASQTTNGGVAGTADCGIFVFWKRAVGSTTTTDPVPVFQAPSAQSGTSWCLQPNSFSGARTSGTPYNAISKSIVTTATTAVTSTAATSTLANCLFMPRVASANDDQAFNNWTFTGSAGPSGSGAPNTGWHSGTGNACAFTGAEGGFATAGGPHTATTTFATSTKQALITLVMASLAEPTAATGNEAATLGSSNAASAGGVVATGSTAGTLGVSAPASAGAVTVTGAGAATLDASGAAITGSAITRTGDESRVLAASIASSTGSVTGGPTGTEVAALAGSSGTATGAITVTGAATDALAGSGASAAGSISITGSESAADSASSAAATGSVFTPSTLGIGAVAFRQKANTTAPNTGTLTTLAVYPAWTALTSYQLVNAVRVTNAGNCYELAQSGTSGAVGPTGTGAAIADGTCKWNFLAAGTGACDTQSTGSLVLASIGIGKDATAGHSPTDNKGNTYSLVNRSFYAGFPPSSSAVHVVTGASGGAGHTLSNTYGLGNDGGGDEITNVLVEIIGGTHIQDHSHGEVNPTANVCTSLPVTTTGPAVLVAFWWLNGNVQPDGFLHTATPGSGFTALPLASGLMEIANGAGQVQMATAYKVVAAPGTYTATITTAPVAGTPEGAIVHLLAIQGPAGINGTEAASSSASSASSTGTVTTPRTGTEAASLGSSSGASAGTLSLTGSAAAGIGDSIGGGRGTVTVTGSAATAAGASIAASSGTLIPIVAGNEAAALSASLAASFGTVFSGRAGDVGAMLLGSLVVSAGSVVATGSASGVDGGGIAATAGAVAIVGAGALASGDSQPASRGTVRSPAGPLQRLAGSLSRSGKLFALLQLEGAIVIDLTGPITIEQGDDVDMLITITDDAGARVDLGGYAIELQVKPAIGAPDPPTIAKSIADGSITPLNQTDPATRGQAAFSFASAETNIAPRLYWLDVVAINAAGKRQHPIAPREFTIAGVVNPP